MTHSSKNCPACNKELKKGDDIVHCPECGAPYHRECYKKEGRCMFESKHASGFEYQIYENPELSDNSFANTENSNNKNSSFGGQHVKKDTHSGYQVGTNGGVTCPSCSTVNVPSAIFCTKCGTPLHAAKPQANAPNMQNPFFAVNAAPELNSSVTVDGFSYQDWKDYIGPSHQNYIYKMLVMEKRGSKISPMLSAFFLGPFYFAYRKMWGCAALSFLLTGLSIIPAVMSIMVLGGHPAAASFTVGLVNNLSDIAWVISLVAQILCGCFALPLYKRKAVKYMTALKAKSLSREEHQGALLKKGGTSAVGVLLVLAATLAIALVTGRLLGTEVIQAYQTAFLNQYGSLFNY